MSKPRTFFENCLKTPKFAAMTAEEILKLINPEDNSDLAKAARQDLQNGGPCLLGLDIRCGYVTTIITQPENASTSPFEIISDTYTNRMRGVAEREITIRRTIIPPADIAPWLTEPECPAPVSVAPRRGGARPGSEHKPIKDEDRKRNVTVSFRVNAATRDALQELRAQGIDINVELEKLVARLTKRDTKG